MTETSLLTKTLISRKLTLATAESCTGGLIAKTLTDNSGSSAFFVAGLVTYSNETKTRLLRIPASTIARYGAVSAPVAKAMAVGARHATGSDLAVATTGIAGPTGGTPQKPVGLVFIAVSSARKTVCRRFCFKGNRQSIRRQAMEKSLAMLSALVSSTPHKQRS